MGRRRKYATAEEAKAAQKAQQAAFRAARKNGTWVRKNRSSSSLIPHPSSLSLRARRKEARIASEEAVKVLKLADRLVQRKDAEAAKIAAKEAERAGRQQDWELADKEMQKRREAAERRERARKAHLTPEEREEERKLVAAARERQIALARERYGFTLYGEDKTPEEAEGRRRYLADQAKVKAEAAKKRERKRSKLMQKYRAKRLSAEAAMSFAAEQARTARDRDEGRGVRDEMRVIEAGLPRNLARFLHPSSSSLVPHTSYLTLKEKHELLLERYGFKVWKKDPQDPNSEAEKEARRRYVLDSDAEYRKRNHNRITVYNREYRRRKRAEALAKRQRTWTAAEWEKWQAREKAKELGKGSPAWFVGEVAKVLAAEEGISTDDVTQRLIELEGLDFLMKGAEAIGPKKASRPGMVKGAARALGLWLDPDNALLFKLRDVKPRK